MTTTYINNVGPGSALTSGIAIATLNAGKDFAGSEIDNTTNRYEFLDLELLYQLAATPAAGAPLKIFVLYAFGGTTYEDGIPSTNDGTAAAAPTQQPTALVGVIGVTADTSAHRVTLKGIPLLPYKFKIVVNNGTAVALSTSNLVVNAYGRKTETVG